MILGYTAAQVRAAEAPLLEAGVPLMQRAAAGLAHEVRALLGRDGVRVLLLVGSGNNGADTLYAGATLSANGAEVTIVRAGDRVHAESLEAAVAAGARELTGDENAGARELAGAESGGARELAGAEAAERAGGPTPSEIARLAASVDVVIDGILGTGTSANAALRGTGREIVAAILAAGVTTLVVAVDIPSGIDPTTGGVPDPCVLRATLTVTFGGYKAGLLLAPAREYAGEVRLVDIGMGEQLALMQPVVRLER